MYALQLLDTWVLALPTNEIEIELFVLWHKKMYAQHRRNIRFLTRRAHTYVHTHTVHQAHLKDVGIQTRWPMLELSVQHEYVLMCVDASSLSTCASMQPFDFKSIQVLRAPALLIMCAKTHARMHACVLSCVFARVRPCA